MVQGLFVQEGTNSAEFKDALKNPLCINITFGNGTGYLTDEVNDIDIEQSVCLRILYLYDTEHSSFGCFYHSYKAQEFSLLVILESLGAKNSCIILGIDEVNKVHDADYQMRKKLSGLFTLVGGVSFESSPFFVPILAGTAIGPIKEGVRESTHTPLHIPLPLLSLESCLNIFEKMNTDYSQLFLKSRELKRLISNCGGHGRTLEMLYDALKKFKESDNSYWDNITKSVQTSICQRYDVSDFPLGAAIALSFLCQSVSENDRYPGYPTFRLQDLEEKGLIKLENGFVKISFFFVCSFLINSGTTEFSRFWKRLLGPEELRWQEWEVFNRNYILFRLSLYAYLKVDSVPLTEFFAGAKMNIPADIEIKIPSLAALKVSKIDYQYPATRAPAFDIGTSVLNGDCAVFDSFMYLETTAGNPLLLAFQTNQHIRTQQVVSDASVYAEFHKINDAVAKNLPGTYFVAIILERSEGTFIENNLPSSCIVVAKSEQAGFYGDRMLNNFV